MVTDEQRSFESAFEERLGDFCGHEGGSFETWRSDITITERSGCDFRHRIWMLGFEKG
jgi:hypothetical protein